jgi:type IV pilus assembly protein PilQ
MKRIRQTSVVGALALALIAGASVQAALSDERVVRDILVEQSSKETVVRVVSDGAIRYAVSEHQSPHRLLLDLADATIVGPSGSISVDNGQVGDILSVSTDEDGRRSSRVALELAEGSRYQVSSHEGTVEIRISGEPTDRLMAQAAPTETTASDAAPAANSSPAANEVGNVAYQHDGHVDRIKVTLPEGATYLSLPWNDNRATLLIENAALPAELQRQLDTAKFKGTVRAVSSFVDPQGRVRIVADLVGAGSELIRMSGRDLIWEFTPARVEESEPERAQLPQPITSAKGEATLPTSVSDNPYQRRPRMNRKRITIDLRDADIHNILRLIADEGNVNIVTNQLVAGSVTLRLRSVPLDEALAIILRSNGLGWEQQGNIIRVAPMTVFEAESKARIDAYVQSQGLEPLQVRLIAVNYAEAVSLAEILGGVLSTRGKVKVDDRKNALIVTDVLANLDTAEALVRQLDTQTPQILIEARIVESNDQFKRDLGIQWGGDFLADPSIGNATGLLFPSTVGIAGGASSGDTPTGGGSSTPNYAINLPAPAGPGSGGAVGFTFGSLSGAFNLNLRLSAAESQGSVKIVSAPRITTLDNEEATITSGVSIPVSVVSAAGAQTVFFDASLTLTVTPRVTPDGNIIVDVNVNKNEPDFENTGSRGDPSIIRREASTKLLIRDGDTTVIGGIFQRNTGSSNVRIPFLGALPLIGPLFRNASHTDVRNELLVFLTPRIVNRDLSIDRDENTPDILPPQE